MSEISESLAVSRQYNPAAMTTTLRALLTETLDRSDRYLKSLDTRPVAPRDGAGREGSGRSRS